MRKILSGNSKGLLLDTNVSLSENEGGWITVRAKTVIRTLGVIRRAFMELRPNGDVTIRTSATEDNMDIENATHWRGNNPELFKLFNELLR